MKNLFILGFCALITLGAFGCSKKKIINPFLGTWEQHIVDADGKKSETSSIVKFEQNMDYSDTSSDSENSKLTDISGVYTFNVQNSQITITLDKDGGKTTYIYLFTLRQLNKANSKRIPVMELIGIGDKSNIVKRYVRK